MEALISSRLAAWRLAPSARDWLAEAICVAPASISDAPELTSRMIPCSVETRPSKHWPTRPTSSLEVTPVRRVRSRVRWISMMLATSALSGASTLRTMTTAMMIAKITIAAEKAVTSVRAEAAASSARSRDWDCSASSALASVDASWLIFGPIWSRPCRTNWSRSCCNSMACCMRSVQ